MDEEHIYSEGGIDFDMKHNCVFWYQLYDLTLYRNCLNKTGHRVSTPLMTSQAYVSSLSYDWMSETLYFIDKHDKRIDVVKVIYMTVIRSLRGLCVGP